MTTIEHTRLSKRAPIYSRKPGEAEITIYPRVHMFGLDMSLQNSGIPCGSMGASIMDMPIRVMAKQADRVDKFSDEYTGDGNVADTLQRLRQDLSTTDHWDVAIQIPDKLRAHTGLGTSTQILGGVALCAAKVSGFNLNHKDLFNLGFGHASNLGLSLLYNPGFIIEYGYEPSEHYGTILHPTIPTAPEQPTDRISIIKDCPWDLILGLPKNSQSISGSIENTFWEQNLPQPAASAQYSMYVFTNQLMPSLESSNFASFIDSAAKITGQGTKKAEERIQSRQTLKALNVLRREFGFAAVSSLGPALYAFAENNKSGALANLESEDYIFHKVKLQGQNKP